MDVRATLSVEYRVWQSLLLSLSPRSRSRENVVAARGGASRAPKSRLTARFFTRSHYHIRADFVRVSPVVMTKRRLGPRLSIYGRCTLAIGKKEKLISLPRCLGGALVFELHQKCIGSRRRNGGAFCVPRDARREKKAKHMKRA
jgi:hypothetical protein